jgi:hypothetical protein
MHEMERIRSAVLPGPSLPGDAAPWNDFGLDFDTMVATSEPAQYRDDSGSFESVPFRRALPWVALGVGILGVFCLVRSGETRRRAETTPRVTCGQLAQNGPGSHRHLTLTDAWLSAGKSVAERDSETNALEMYHPVYAVGLNVEPAPRDLKLILCILDEAERRRIRDARNAAEQQGQRGLGDLVGAVAKADGLPQWARSRLRATYPDIRLDDCWVVTVGADEPTPRRAERLFWVGLGATLAALALACGWWLWQRFTRWEVESK